jgi:hypothetical protein
MTFFVLSCDIEGCEENYTNYMHYNVFVCQLLVEGQYCCIQEWFS